MSAIKDLIRETESPANSFSPDVIKYAFEAHQVLKNICAWLETTEHMQGCKIIKYAITDSSSQPTECTCGLGFIRHLIRE